MHTVIDNIGNGTFQWMIGSQQMLFAEPYGPPTVNSVGNWNYTSSDYHSHTLRGNGGGDYVVDNGGAPDVRQVAYASTITPTIGPGIGEVVEQVGTLTGPLLVGPISGTPGPAQKVTFWFTENSTGGYPVTWDASYAFGQDSTVAMQTPSQAPNGSWELRFEWHPELGQWRCIGIQRF